MRNKEVMSDLHPKGFDHFTIRYLTEDLPALEVIDAQRPVEEALAKMCAKEYSQLPVTQGKVCIGAITLESVIRQLVKESRKGNRGLDFMDWPVKRFVEKDVRFVRDEDDLVKHLEWLAERGFVIVGSNRKWESVVTNYDLVHFFKNETEVYLLLREIETCLRFTVLKILGEKRLKRTLHLVRRKNGTTPSSINDLSFDELRGFIRSNWKQLKGFFLDESRVDDQLVRIARLRNRVFHFKSTVLAPELNSIKRLRDNYVNLAISLVDESK